MNMEHLKGNERAFCFLSKEEQDYLKEHIKDVQRLGETSSGAARWIGTQPYVLQFGVYRLKEDHVCKWEPERGEVYYMAWPYRERNYEVHRWEGILEEKIAFERGLLFRKVGEAVEAADKMLAALKGEIK